MNFTIDVDCGGTFTDAFVSKGNEFDMVKVGTTPHDLTVCFWEIIEEISRRESLTPAELLSQTNLVRFSTTTGTNTLIQKNGPRVGLIVTEGNAANLYQSESELRKILDFIDSEMVAEVSEEVDLTGNVVTEPDSSDVLSIVENLLDSGARYIVVCLQNAGKNSSNEKAIKKILEAEYPKHYLGAVPTLLSSQASTAAHDGERLVTSVLNAYIHPDMIRFLYKADEMLRLHQFRHPLLVGHASGGAARVAKTKGLQTFNSGPAAGMLGAVKVAREGAKIMQVAASTVAKDPALAVQSALQIRQLLAPQGMVLYDPAAFTLALGGQMKEGMVFSETAKSAGNLAISLETAQRLSATLGKDAAVFAAVPGPVESVLAMTESGQSDHYLLDSKVMNQMGKLLIDMAKEYLENRADGLVVVERKSCFVRPELGQVYSQFLTTIGNIAGYYGVPLVIYLQGQEEVGELPASLTALDFKGMFLDASAKSTSLAETLRNVGDRVLGLTVPEDLLLQMSEGVHDYLQRIAAELPGKRLMMSVPWSMTEDISVSHIKGLNDLLKEAI